MGRKQLLQPDDYLVMGYHPRKETADMASFLTSSCRNAEMWFANNLRLEQAILGLTAKYGRRSEVKLYAFAIEGNHIQGVADFPKLNRADFMRDLNSNIARAVPRYTPSYPGGGLFARRYSSEFLPGAEDVEDRFFYTVLQPVQDGLVERLSDYPFYNCFSDAVRGIARKFKVVRWAEYNAARQRKRKVCIKDYTDEVELRYERLPGYEHLSQRKYCRLMHEKLEAHRTAIVEQRKKAGLAFLGAEKLLDVVPGARPKNTKQTGAYKRRPRVLSKCPERRAYGNAFYFSFYFHYKEASLRYRSGELDVAFPEGAYRPPMRAQAPPRS